MWAIGPGGAAPRLALLLAGLLLGPGTAAADLIGADDLAKITRMAQGYGSASLTADSSGDPMIDGEIDGIVYVVRFYGCTDGMGCSEIQFRAVWTGNDRFDFADMNEWNRTRRFGKAYLDGRNDPVIEMLVNLHAGVSPQNLADSFEWWHLVLQGFRDEVIDR